MQLNEYQASQLARAAADVAGYLAAMKVDLYQTDIDLATFPPIATFTAEIANFTGYAQGVVTWDTPSVADDGTVEVLGAVPQWRPTDAVTPNNVYGIFCRAAAGGGALLFTGRFDDAPEPMASALDQITITIRYRPADRSLCVVVS